MLFPTDFEMSSLVLEQNSEIPEEVVWSQRDHAVPAIVDLSDTVD